MVIVFNIIKAIIKSAVSNKVESELVNELIDISIDGISEKSIDKINDFINGKKSIINHVLSKENMKSMNISEDNIDFVIAEIKDLLFKIELTDEVFRSCDYNSAKLKEFLWNEYYMRKKFIEHESNIKSVLHNIAEVLIRLMNESEEFEKDFLIQISNSVDDTNLELQKISIYIEENFNKINEKYQAMFEMLRIMLEQIQMSDIKNDKEGIVTQNKKFQNNKKKDYMDNWSSILFLHQNNNLKPITLEETFIVPDYKINKYIERIGFTNDDTLDEIIDRFVKYNKNSTMLITGVPGIGKSSITSWIANRYKNDNRFIILRFRDWEREELENGLLKSICNMLECKKIDLNDRILILDGFDEMKSLDVREKVLNNFINDINDFDFLKVIITSRPTYIDSSYFQNVIELQKFDFENIKTFYKKITGNSLDKKDKIESNLEVLGIPVILYMAIMSNVDISEKFTKPELYNRIFAKEGGIFDRFSHDGVGYDKGAQVLRNQENIKKYLEFLRFTAFKMFEKNSLLLNKGEYQIPELDFQGKSVSVLEFPIKNLFEKSEAYIEFIHKSIYEYFVAEYIFISLDENINMPKEKIAGVLGILLKSNKLSAEILEFLSFKINNSELNDKYDIVNKTFQLMLQDGMTYHTDKSFKNVIDCEMNVFFNLLEIAHLWKGYYLEFGSLVNNYLYYNRTVGLNLERANLMGISLEEVDLKGANLKRANLNSAILERAKLKGAELEETKLNGAELNGANLVGANLNRAELNGAELVGAKLNIAKLNGAKLVGVKLNGANLNRAELVGAELMGAELVEAKLIEANLIQADLREINLQDTNLEYANLKDTIFDEEQVYYLESKYNLQEIIVYIKKTGEKIKYKDYCNRRQRKSWL